MPATTSVRVTSLHGGVFPGMTHTSEGVGGKAILVVVVTIDNVVVAACTTLTVFTARLLSSLCSDMLLAGSRETVISCGPMLDAFHGTETETPASPFNVIVLSVISDTPSRNRTTKEAAASPILLINAVIREQDCSKDKEIPEETMDKSAGGGTIDVYYEEHKNMTMRRYWEKPIRYRGMIRTGI